MDMSKSDMKLLISALIMVFFAISFAVTFLASPELTYEFLEKRGLPVAENIFPVIFFLTILFNLLFFVWLYDGVMELMNGVPKSIPKLKQYLEKVFIQNSIGLVFVILFIGYFVMQGVECITGIRMLVQDPGVPHFVGGVFLIIVYILILDYRYRHRDDGVV